MVAGSLQAIWYELRHGDVFTVIDEVLHAWPFYWLIGNTTWRHRFCNWSHTRDIR